MKDSGISLDQLKENDEITNENLAKAIVLFIKEKRKNKNLLLSQLYYKSLKYNITYKDNLNLKNNLNIFNFICNIRDCFSFGSLSKEIIEQKLDSPLVNFVNLDEINL